MTATTSQPGMVAALGLLLFVAPPALAAGQDPKAPLASTGSVIDQAGAPLPGARGIVFASSILEPAFTDFEADREGRFVVKQLPRDGFHLVVFPKQLGAETPAPRLLRNRRVWDPTPIRMEEGVAMRARLLDTNGMPVPGSVRFLSVSGVELPDSVPIRAAVAPADPTGRVAFNGPVGTHKFIAEGPEHIPQVFERRVPSPESSKAGASPHFDLGTFTLKPALTIRGRVEDDLGQPLDGVTLATYTNPRSTQVDTFKARSGLEGRFELRGLVEGNVLLHAGLKSYYSEYADLRAGDQDAVIVMARTGAIAGRVVDGQGEPIAGVVVNFRGAGKLAGRGLGQQELSTPEFTLADLPPVTAHVFVTAPGFRPKTLEDVRVMSAQTIDLGEISLDRGRTLTGHVVDEKDVAVPGATVAAWLSGANDRASVAADNEGEFRLSGLSPGLLEFETVATGYSPARSRIEMKESEDPDPIRIVLGKGGRINGSVMTKRGTPVSGALVNLSPIGDTAGTTRMETTSPSGGFEFTGLPTGRVLVSVLGASSVGTNMLSSFSTLVGREIALRAGEAARSDFVLREIEIVGRVSGVSASEGLRVFFSNPRGGSRSFGDGRPGGAIPTSSGVPRFGTNTDAAGAFRLVVDEPGRYFATVLSANSQRTPLLRQAVDVPDLPPDVNEFPVDLVVTSARISGVIVDKETNRAISGAFVNLGTGLNALTMVTRADGRFEAYSPAGPLDLVVTAEGYGRREIALTVTEKSDEKRIELAPATPGADTLLSGTVRFKSGQPASLAFVRALSLDRDSRVVRSTQADAAGRFAWTDALPGRYVIWGSLGRELLGHSKSETAKAPVDIELHAAVRVTYTVIDQMGAEVNDAWLEAQSVDGIPLWTSLSAGLGSLPPGRVVLKADSLTHAGTSTVEVRAGEPLAITVRAQPKPKPKP